MVEKAHEHPSIYQQWKHVMLTSFIIIKAFAMNPGKINKNGTMISYSSYLLIQEVDGVAVNCCEKGDQN